MKLGNILDWVPSIFPGDEWFAFFDGSFLRTRRPKKRISPRLEIYFQLWKKRVKSFLISNACFWLDRYHADGLCSRCSKCSMLELDYSRADGEWEPNKYGDNRNLKR